MVSNIAALATTPAAAPAAPADASVSWGSRVVSALTSAKEFVVSSAYKLYDLVLPLINRVSDMFTKDRAIALPAMAFAGAVIGLGLLINKCLCGEKPKPATV